MSTKKPTTSRRTLIKGTAATAAIAPFFIGRSAKAGEAEITLKLATVAPKDTPWHRLAAKMTKHIEEKTEGRVNIKGYYGGSLGDEGTTAEACKAGRIGIYGGSATGLGISELEALELPYLFDSSTQAQKAILANRQRIHDLLWDRGFKLVLFAENGFRSLGTTFPVEKPSDLKGRKIRTQQTKCHIATFKGFGASPVPMGITEVLSSLQTGVVEGYDNTKLFAFAAALYMATTHWTETKHIYQPGIVVMSRKGAWDKLPKDLQEVIELESDEVLKMEDRGFRTVRALDGQLSKNFHDIGVEVTEPDLAAFRKVAGAVHADFKKRTTKDGSALLDALKKAT